MGRRAGLDHIPELVLALVTVVVAVGFGRLFLDGSLVPPLILAALAGHALAVVLRRRDASRRATVVVAAVAFVLFVAWVIEPFATRYGLPTWTTVRTVWSDLGRGRQTFFQDRAPVEPLRGLAIAATAAVWATALLADWAAFRLARAYQALLPSFVIFVFSAIEGPVQNRIPVVTIYLVCALAFVVVFVGIDRTGASPSFSGRPGAGRRALLHAGASVGAVTMAGGLVLGVALPRPGNRPLIDWHKTPAHDPRLSISPLVDIRSRLVQQTDSQMFTVQSPVPSYWRLTSLSDFDGKVWRADGVYRKVTTALKGDGVRRSDVRVKQSFTIAALSSIWLPAAYRPARLGDVVFIDPSFDQLAIDPSAGAALAATDVTVDFDVATGSMLTKNATSNGLNYDVESELAQPDVAVLTRAKAAVPSDIADEDLVLPAEFPARVRELARSVTHNATTAYAKALALQNFFRDGSFTYSLDVVPGHSDNAMVRFLFADRRGYCEQFAGTYAAMARSIGLPARVAVGFTPGELRNGFYTVTGRQAHAWPEVYIGGYGWVAFEPTPGRGVPGAEGYTGVAFEQDVDSGESTTATTVVPGGGVTTGSTIVSRVPASTTTVPRPTSTTVPVKVTHASPWPRRVGGALAVLLLIVIVWAVGVPVLLSAARGRRRRAAVTPTERTLLAWSDTLDELATAGVRRKASETPFEYARRAERAASVSTPLLAELAGNVTVASYHPSGVNADVADRSEHAAATIASMVGSRRSVREKVVRVVDPRPLVKRP